jgi:hypothetical protein
MAFATANVRRGNCGDIKITAGDWTGAAGDASGTINVEGGRVYGAEISAGDATTPTESIPYTYAVGTNTNTITVTFHNRSTTSSGRFIIWHA